MKCHHCEVTHQSNQYNELSEDGWSCEVPLFAASADKWFCLKCTIEQVIDKLNNVRAKEEELEGNLKRLLTLKADRDAKAKYGKK